MNQVKSMRRSLVIAVVVAVFFLVVGHTITTYTHTTPSERIGMLQQEDGNCVPVPLALETQYYTFLYGRKLGAKGVSEDDAKVEYFKLLDKSGLFGYEVDPSSTPNMYEKEVFDNITILH